MSRFTPATRMRCHACGTERPRQELPFRCPHAGAEDDLDHLLRRELDIGALALQLPEPFESGTDENPFVRWRHFLHGYQAMRARGAVDSAWHAAVSRLDDAIAALDGHGFVATPLARQAELASALGVASVHVKDETRNVAGSHKSRHMMGIALALETYDVPRERPLAVASCGNAALAAAVIARAAGRPLTVYVPPDADAVVVDKLRAAEAIVAPCPREAGRRGDPCYLAFQRALIEGALPLSVQGADNGLAVEGALPLGYEHIVELASAGEQVDAVMLQVGGGALASAVIAAWRDAYALGFVERLPRFFAVQTQGARPLARAFTRLTKDALRMLDVDRPQDLPVAERARQLLLPTAAAVRAATMARAARTRSRYMWPWELEPHSIAHGILDDETYDWHAICAGLLDTGGWVVTASEDDLARANELGRAAGYPVCHTGSSGLAGAIALARDGHLDADARVLVIFSGNHRE
ncbi:MAG: pyridoxal-phosphate dependent enzyme [Myxococcales bacterium]|nr:pyridoxal-phosphate dependent enzyme [Myxococcales bacterium]